MSAFNLADASITEEIARAFAELYLQEGTARKAAIALGIPPEKAGDKGTQMLLQPAVREALKEVARERIAKSEITKDMIVQELAKIAFGDLGDVVEWSNGFPRIKDSATLDPAALAQISGVKMTANGLQITRHDKIKALETIARVQGMMIEKKHKTIDGKVTITVQRVDKVTQKVADNAQDALNSQNIIEAEFKDED